MTAPGQTAADAINALDWDAVYTAARLRVSRDACMQGYDFHLAREIAERLAATIEAAARESAAKVAESAVTYVVGEQRDLCNRIATAIRESSQ